MKVHCTVLITQWPVALVPTMHVLYWFLLSWLSIIIEDCQHCCTPPCNKCSTSYPTSQYRQSLKKWYQTTKLKAWSFGMFPASAQKCPQAFWRSSNSCISAVLGKRVSVLRYLYGRINVLSQWKDKTLPRIQLTGLTCVERDQSPRRCGEAKRLAAVAHVEINAGSACAKCYHCLTPKRTHFKMKSRQFWCPEEDQDRIVCREIFFHKPFT